MGPPDLGKRELDRWAIKVLWVMLDVGLLGNITEEDFTRAFLYRENENWKHDQKQEETDDY
jgi:hypothetical protein